MPYYRGDAIGFRGDYYRGDYYRGDPGLFSFIGKALGGVAKIGLGFVRGQLGLPTGGGTGIAPIRSLIGPGSGIYTQPGGGQQCPPGTACSGTSYDGFCAGTCVPVPAGGGGTSVVMAGGGGACPRGFHMNKSSYVTRGGGTSHWPPGLQVHPKGSTCVKTRRMNVGNARALRRSLRRVSGFAKLVKRSRRAVARAASAVGVHHRGKLRGRSAPSVRIVKAA